MHIIGGHLQSAVAKGDTTASLLRIGLEETADRQPESRASECFRFHAPHVHTKWNCLPFLAQSVLFGATRKSRKEAWVSERKCSELTHFYFTGMARSQSRLFPVPTSEQVVRVETSCALAMMSL